jgi:hypothetical protein
MGRQLEADEDGEEGGERDPGSRGHRMGREVAEGALEPAGRMAA